MREEVDKVNKCSFSFGITLISQIMAIREVKDSSNKFSRLTSDGVEI